MSIFNKSKNKENTEAPRSAFMIDLEKRNAPIEEERLLKEIDACVRRAVSEKVPTNITVDSFYDAYDDACEKFGWGPNTGKKDSLLKLFNYILEKSDELNNGGFANIDIAKFSDKLTAKTVAAVEDGRKLLDDEYKNGGKDLGHMTKENYTLWLKWTSDCIIILESLPKHAFQESTVNRIYSDLKRCQDAMIHSKSIKYITSFGVPQFRPDTRLSPDAVSVRRAQLAQYVKDRQKRIEELNDRKRSIRSRYWDDHSDEHNRLLDRIDKLEAERAPLDEEYTSLNDMINAFPEKQELEELYAKASAVDKEYDSAGYFNVPKRLLLIRSTKGIRASINEKKSALSRKTSPYSGRIFELKKRISEIDEELCRLNAKLTGVD